MTHSANPTGTLPAVSPRFGQPTYDPDRFEVHTIDNIEAPTEPDGTPVLKEPKHKVTPLDLERMRELVKQTKPTSIDADADGELFDETPRKITVRDSQRKYQFTGIRLAFVSSETDIKTRWTEIELYRTQGGIYINHRIGASTLAHTADCVQVRKYHKRNTPSLEGVAEDEVSVRDREPCPECNPDIADMLEHEPGRLRFERDRHTVTIAETAETLLQSLHTNRNGIRALGPLARLAAQTAADRDPLIAAVFYGHPESEEPIVYQNPALGTHQRS